jgi:hypothetical protein
MEWRAWFVGLPQSRLPHRCFARCSMLRDCDINRRNVGGSHRWTPGRAEDVLGGHVSNS